MALENSEVLDVPRVIDSPASNSADDERNPNSQGTDVGLQAGPASVANGAREFFSGIRGHIGTVEDYERAKQPRNETVCAASQWWWTSGVAVCTPIGPSGEAAHR